MRFDLSEMLFSSAGRLGRGSFLAASLGLVAVLATYDQALGPLGHRLLGWIVKPVLFFCGACVVSKRFHDFGRSGWRGSVVLAAFCLVWPHPHGVLGALAAIVLAWSAIELGVTPRQPGFNRFGAR